MAPSRYPSRYPSWVELGGSFEFCREAVFNLNRSSHPHFLMRADSGVVIDILGNIVLKLLSSLIKVMGQLFPFHAGEEGLRDCAVQRDSGG